MYNCALGACQGRLDTIWTSMKQTWLWWLKCAELLIFVTSRCTGLATSFAFCRAAIGESCASFSESLAFDTGRVGSGVMLNTHGRLMVEVAFVYYPIHAVQQVLHRISYSICLFFTVCYRLVCLFATCHAGLYCCVDVVSRFEAGRWEQACVSFGAAARSRDSDCEAQGSEQIRRITRS